MHPILLLPHPALQPYIHHYVYTSVGVAGQWSDFGMVPPGCTALPVVMGGRDVWLKADDGPARKFDSVAFSGQATYFRKISINDLYEVFFVIFKPCGAYQLLGVGQHNCLNDMFNLSDLLGKKASQTLRHQLEDSPGVEETRSILEKFLLQRLLRQKNTEVVRQFDDISSRIRRQSGEPMLIREMCKQEGMSKSTMERQLKEIIGMGPKQFQRIARFNASLQFIKQQHSFRHWTEVAYQFGYYDQAHFIKEFKLFYGKTPSSYSTNDEMLTNIAH